MTLPEFGSYCAVYLVGALTGATGKYLADKYTDQRRQQQSDRDIRRVFDRLVAEMAPLINEMRVDIADADNASVREFIVLPSSHVVFNSGGRRYLCYYEDQHDDLMGKIAVLENHGFVTDTTSSNVSKYRMSEDLVRLLGR